MENDQQEGTMPQDLKRAFDAGRLSRDVIETEVVQLGADDDTLFKAQQALADAGCTPTVAAEVLNLFTARGLLIRELLG